MVLTQFTNKVENRLRIEFLHLPIVFHLAKKSYEKKLSKHKNRLAILNNEDKKIIDTLRQEGVFVTTLDNLSIAKTSEAVNVATDLLLNSSELVYDSNCKGIKGIPGDILQKYPEIILWGLDNRLLNLAENYIGLPIFYLGAEVKRDFPNGESAGVRKWHLDTEDHRMIKIIVYLNDVNDEGGPFQYIPRDRSSIAVKDLGYKRGLISDEVMEQYVPRQDWISCVGKQYTATIVDTASVFHRAKPSVSQERLSITFHYISQEPIFFRSKNLSISTGVKHMCENITERQFKCLFPG